MAGGFTRGLCACADSSLDDPQLLCSAECHDRQRLHRNHHLRVRCLAYAALAVVFATISVAVPSMAAELVGGTVGLAIAHAFEAAYTAQTIAKIVNPITQLGAAITGRDKNKATSSQDRFAMDSVVSNQQRDSAATAAASATTKVLNPNNGRPPGYNLASDNSSQSRQEHLADCKTGIVVDRQHRTNGSEDHSIERQ